MLLSYSNFALFVFGFLYVRPHFVKKKKTVTFKSKKLFAALLEE